MIRAFALLLLAASVAFAGLLDDVRREQPSGRVAELIAFADAAQLRGELEPESAGIVIKDTAWIRRASEAIQATALARPVGCLCMGSQTAYFYRKGQFVASVAAIHGHQLRVRWGGGGGDYPVDEASWEAVNAALTPL